MCELALLADFDTVDVQFAPSAVFLTAGLALDQIVTRLLQWLVRREIQLLFEVACQTGCTVAFRITGRTANRTGRNCFVLRIIEKARSDYRTFVKGWAYAA